jgi:membrane peptidoglycan carboxypeptidase
VSIDPTSGAIKMIFSGADYLKRQQNAATQDIAQAGSTFKPIALAAALEEGYSLNQTFSGRSPITIGDWKVANLGNTSYGQITLLKATQSSVNTVYAQLNEKIGGQTTKTAAIAAGVPANTIGLTSDLTNVLGTASVHPIDMARVYATFAAQGVRHETYIVEAAFSAEGREVYSGRNEGQRVFQANAMAEVTYALTRVVQSGTGTAAQRLGRPAAGKTGTSEEHRSAWFCGYTPQLATAVAFYQEGPNGEVVSLTPFGQNSVINGGGEPARIWVEVMKIGLEGLPVEQFPDRPKSQDQPTPGISPDVEPSVTPSYDASPTGEPPEETPSAEPTQPTQTPSADPSPTPTLPDASSPPPSPTPGGTASPQAARRPELAVEAGDPLAGVAA